MGAACTRGNWGKTRRQPGLRVEDDQKKKRTFQFTKEKLSLWTRLSGFSESEGKVVHEHASRKEEGEKRKQRAVTQKDDCFLPEKRREKSGEMGG